MNLNPVVRHATIFIILWLIIAAISLPLSMKLDTVTEFNAERMLPNGTESMTANEILSDILSEHKGAGLAQTSMAVDIVIVKGVNTTNKELIEWDKDLNESIKDYVEDYYSPYSLIREIIEEAKPELEKTSNNIYNELNETVEMLNRLYDHRDDLIKFINILHEMLYQLKEGADEAYKNRDEIFREANITYQQLIELKNAYINMSTGYNKTVNGLHQAYNLTLSLEEIIRLSDLYYYKLAKQSNQTYLLIQTLNNTLIGTNELYYNTSQTYTRLLFDVARIEYYLIYNTQAYEKGLSSIDVYNTIKYTNLTGEPVDPKLIYLVYLYTVKYYDPSNITTADLYNIANNITETMLANQPTQYKESVLAYIKIYSKVMYEVSEKILKSQGVSNYFQVLSIDPVKGQLALKSILLKAREYSLKPAVETYSDIMADVMVKKMNLPENASTVIKKLLVQAYNLGYPIDPSKVEEIVINTTAEMLYLLTHEKIDETIYYYLKILYENGPSTKAAAEALKLFMEKNIPLPDQIRYIVYKTIITSDPLGKGVLYYDPILAEEKAVSIVSKITSLDENILKEILLHKGLNIPEVAEKLMEKMIIEKTNSSQAILMAKFIAEHHGMVSKDLFIDFLEEVFAIQMNSSNTAFTRNIAEWIGERIWNNDLTLEDYLKIMVAQEIFRSLANMSSNGCFGSSKTINFTELLDLPMVNAIINDSYDPNNWSIIIESVELLFENTIPKDNQLLISHMDLDKLLWELVKVPKNADSNELVNVFIETIVSSMMNTSKEFIDTGVIEDVLRDILLDKYKPLDAIIEHVDELMPSNMSKELDIDKIKNALKLSLELSNPKILFNAMYDCMVDKVFDNITDNVKGIMISPEGDAFILIFKPKDDSKAYENSLEIKRIVKETIIKHGFYPSYIGVTGEDILEEEMKSTGSKDIKTVNNISMIAPILIALILIGGFVAAGLPFIGIGLSVLLSSAILYILALLGIVEVTNWSRMLLVTTSFGLGMDYSSYIVLRFKEKIAELKNPSLAAHDALVHSLPAIAAASSTDIIGFAVMMLAWDFPILASIGKTVPIAILAVLAASLTFTPALLARFGDKKWFWWPHNVEAGRKPWGGFKLTRGRAIGLILLTIVLGTIGAYGLLTFKGSHDYSVFMPEGTEGYRAYMEFQNTFPAGQLMPVYVVGEVSHGTVWDPVVMSNIRKLAEDIEDIPGVIEVRGPHNPGTKPKELYVGSDNKTFYLEIIIEPSPLSREGVDLVKNIRDIVHKYHSDSFKRLLIGGIAATSMEIEELLNKDFWQKIFPIGLVLMWLAMTLSFMSIWAGIIPLITITVGYMIGVTLASKIPGIYGEPALWFLPLMTFPAVLGVGMDYNSFYMNRQREELGKIAGKPGAGYIASTNAIHAVSHLVIGLGLIVTATYSALILGSSWGVRELGIALAGGVFVTTILAAIIFTPAILSIMGEKAWWPYSRRWKK